LTCTDAVKLAVNAEFPERWAAPGVESPDRRPPDVREEQPPYSLSLCFPRHVEDGAVAADSPREAARAVPAGGLGEHQVGAGGSGGVD
jgi:hypothetical protein